MYLPSFPSIANEFSTNASLVQFSLTACLLGLGIGQLVIGPMSDVRGRRSPLLIFLTMYIVASILSAFAPNISIFIGARFLQGFAAADRKSTRLNSSHVAISYAVFCLKKKTKKI